MNNKKSFDCVEYKRKVQEKHAVDNRGLSGEEKMKRRAEWLETSDNRAARLWRKLRQNRLAATKEG